MLQSLKLLINQVLISSFPRLTGAGLFCNSFFIATFYRHFCGLSPHLSPFFKVVADLSPTFEFYRR